MDLYQIIDEVAERIAAKLAEKLAPIMSGRSGDKPYTVEEAARALGLSGDTIRRRVKAGLLLRVPSVGRVLIPAAEVHRLQSGKARP